MSRMEKVKCTGILLYLLTLWGIIFVLRCGVAVADVVRTMGGIFREN